MRGVPQLDGPFRSFVDGNEVTFMRWTVEGDNGKTYHTQFEVDSIDLLTNDIRATSAFKRVREIADHHANVRGCPCFVCLGLLTVTN